MAYVPGFENDIFISYAHIDDEAASERERWIQRFVADLGRGVRQRIGLHSNEEIKISFDERSLRSNDLLQSLRDNASRSACFVAIVSPSYVARDWPLAELDAFAQQRDARGRIFAIERLPVDKASYPAALAELKHTLFWTQPEHSNTERPLMPDDLSWLEKIHDIAKDIKTLLSGLRGTHGAQQAARERAAVVLEPQRTVLLAQVTDDLNEDRDQVRRYLEQYGIATLPNGTYRQGGADFAADLAADLTKANFFVQLLGRTASRRPPDLKQGYARCQYDEAMRAARKRADFLPLLWRRPDLDPASVMNEDAALLAMPETLAMGLESFKAEIVRRVQQASVPRKPEARHDPTSDIDIFINTELQDLEIARSVQQDFTRLGCAAFLPLFDGTAGVLRDDLEEKIVSCDALALVYGEVKPSWISAQAMVYRKLKPRRAGGKPVRVLLICRAPPQPKQEHGVAMPELREIDYAIGVPDDPIKRVLAELRG